MMVVLGLLQPKPVVSLGLTKLRQRLARKTRETQPFFQTLLTTHLTHNLLRNLHI